MMASMGPATPGTAFPPDLPVAEAGVPTGKNASLWAIQALTKQGLPPQFQELLRYLPVAGPGLPGVKQAGDAFQAIAHLLPKVVK